MGKYIFVESCLTMVESLKTAIRECFNDFKLSTMKKTSRTPQVK
jgi:hypothetical protein